MSSIVETIVHTPVVVSEEKSLESIKMKSTSTIFIKANKAIHEEMEEFISESVYLCLSSFVKLLSDKYSFDYEEAMREIANASAEANARSESDEVDFDPKTMLKETLKPSTVKKTKTQKEPKESKEPKALKIKTPKEPKAPKVKIVKEKKNKIANYIPYIGQDNSPSRCHGLNPKNGLYTQCSDECVELTNYCGKCGEEAQNNENGIPDAGNVEMRNEQPLVYFVDPKGKKSVSYLKFLEKKKISVEEIKEEAQSQNIVIPEEYFMVNEKKSRGRPSKDTNAAETNSVTSNSSEKKGRGRPKKEAKAIVSSEVTDIFAGRMSDEQSDSESESDNEVVLKPKLSKEQKAEEKARKEEEKQKKIVEKAAEKALKEEEKQKKVTEKVAKKPVSNKQSKVQDSDDENNVTPAPVAVTVAAPVPVPVEVVAPTPAPVTTTTKLKVKRVIINDKPYYFCTDGTKRLIDFENKKKFVGYANEDGTKIVMLEILFGNVPFLFATDGSGKIFDNESKEHVGFADPEGTKIIKMFVDDEDDEELEEEESSDDDDDDESSDEEDEEDD